MMLLQGKFSILYLHQSDHWEKISMSANHLHVHKITDVCDRFPFLILHVHTHIRS